MDASTRSKPSGEQLALLADATIHAADEAAHPATGWRLDSATRDRGRRGVADARRALAEAAARRSGGSREQERSAA